MIHKLKKYVEKYVPVFVIKDMDEGGIFYDKSVHIELAIKDRRLKNDYESTLIHEFGHYIHYLRKGKVSYKKYLEKVNEYEKNAWIDGLLFTPIGLRPNIIQYIRHLEYGLKWYKINDDDIKKTVEDVDNIYFNKQFMDIEKKYKNVKNNIWSK